MIASLNVVSYVCLICAAFYGIQTIFKTKKNEHKLTYTLKEASFAPWMVVYLHAVWHIGV